MKNTPDHVGYSERLAYQSLSACRIAFHDDPRRALDHHRPLAGETRENGTNRGRSAGTDVVGLISERTRQRADLERHPHRVIDCL
jgi:hypothetical protein